MHEAQEPMAGNDTRKNRNQYIIAVIISFSLIKYIDTTVK